LLVEKILRENANVSFYENVFIARQDISSAQVDGLVEIFEKIIIDMGGAVPKKELWGLRTMAYKIKKNRKGHYVLMNIEASSEAIHEMERQMNLHEDILRHLTTRLDELEVGPSVMMRSRERGDDRVRQDSSEEDLSISDIEMGSQTIPDYSEQSDLTEIKAKEIDMNESLESTSTEDIKTIEQTEGAEGEIK
jgi:small subunit ribosomal protein S6